MGVTERTGGRPAARSGLGDARRSRGAALPWGVLLLFACAGAPDSVSPEPRETAADTAPADSDTAPVAPFDVSVTVTLDGVPVEGALVMQGGAQTRWFTDAEGRATVRVDPSIVGDRVVLAAHAEARSWGEEVDGPAAITLPLERYDTTDNPLYVFNDPGPESHEGTNTAQCNHCHIELHRTWWPSAHRTSASNTAVHDLYAGTAAAFTSASLCATAGGTWGPGTAPGTGDTVDQCFLGGGVLPDTDGTGACADCHAPGIDGELGGRDLLEATGIAYEAGVHCDVCHHVADVDLSAPPGVGGRLRIQRPSEVAYTPGMGEWQPLMFGPWADVLNPRMGSVYTPLFHEARLCAGCHEQDQAVLVDTPIDLTRWPDGTLPIHSTYSEWEAGPMNPSAPCQSCHMPPLPGVGNGADIYNELDDVSVGIASGWERLPGAVRAHTFYGPRQPESGMLGLAARVDVTSRLEGETLVADVTVTNVGPGHAIPTGEPLRSMLVLVDASCDDVSLVATGGDVVPDFGGSLAAKEAGEDWTSWPGAAVGDTLRVVRRTGAHHDYTGHGPFGDGRFDAEAKGMPVEEIVGTATVLGVADARVTLDRPLPEGDRVYRTAGQAYAGAPGFGFARVLVGADGTRMVPHFAAVDVASDNRLLPTAGWTSTHRFAAPCAAPEVHATVLHRNYPLGLATERGWAVTDQVMDEVRR